MEAVSSHVLNRMSDSDSNSWDERPCMGDWEFFPAIAHANRRALATLLSYARADALPSPRFQFPFH
jgi:hypothetical protein